MIIDEYVEKNQKSVWIGTAVEKFLLNLRSRDIETLGASINELVIIYVLIFSLHPYHEPFTAFPFISTRMYSSAKI